MGVAVIETCNTMECADIGFYNPAVGVSSVPLEILFFSLDKNLQDHGLEDYKKNSTTQETMLTGE